MSHFQATQESPECKIEVEDSVVNVSISRMSGPETDLSGLCFSLHDKTKRLYERVASVLGICCEDQRLSIRGRLMEWEELLSAYGSIEDDWSIVQLVIVEQLLDDRAILTIFFNKCGGTNWSSKNNWLEPESDIRMWDGVMEVDGEGRVTMLVIRGNKLTGNIPGELGQLKALRTLTLSGNLLTGNIPAELGQLVALQSLDLYNNQLTGDIPKEIGRLKALQHLHLERNRLTGSIPGELGRLKALRQLHLHENLLTGSIPSELGQLGSVEQIILCHNRLTGSVPCELGRLAALQGLNLCGNSELKGGPDNLSFVGGRALQQYLTKLRGQAGVGKKGR